MSTLVSPASASFTFFHQPEETSSARLSDGVKIILSREIPTPFSFDSLVLSANFHTQTDGVLLLEAQLKQNGAWSKFYKLALFSRAFRNGFDQQKDENGFVDTDILVPAAPAQSYRYRLSLYGDIEVTLLAGTVTHAGAVYDEAQASCLPGGAFGVDIEPLSQMQMNHPGKNRICSPTALTMALQYFGCPATLEKTLEGVFDCTAGIYGNWIFNTAYAGTFGLESFVTHFNSLAELKDHLHPDSLVLASIAYGEAELTGSAVKSTPGHLVLLQGYEDGRVRVCDPAAETAQSVSRFYDAVEFSRAWIKNKRGVAYIVRKK